MGQKGQKLEISKLQKESNLLAKGFLPDKFLWINEFGPESSLDGLAVT